MIAGTLVEAYLRQRNALPNCGIEDLRFHPQCPMGTHKVPTMVALMRNILTNEPQAIHRTPLNADATQNKIIGKKMMGPKVGAAIKLCPDDSIDGGLGISEGIENGLSAMVFGWSPLWAAGDTGQVENFPVIPGVEHLTIFADADDAGRGVVVSKICAGRWRDSGKVVTVYTPPAGKDWNDIARSRAA